MVESRVKKLAGLLQEYWRMAGRTGNPRDLALVVDPGTAIWLMREISWRWPSEVTVTSDEDELLCIMGVPVRVRIDAPPGEAWIFTREKTPARQCCDRASFLTLMSVITRGEA
jgi:hypothetical protein